MNNGQWKTINNYLKNTTQKINDRATRTTLKTEGELLEKMSRSCSPVTPVELFLLQTRLFAMNEERPECGHLWHIYSLTVYQVMLMTSTLLQGTIGSAASLLAATLYNGNHDRNKTPIFGISYQLRHVSIYKYNLVGDFFHVWNSCTWIILPDDFHYLYLIWIIARALLMFIIRNVRLLEIYCCMSHLVCQLTFINIFILVLINYFTIKI